MESLRELLVGGGTVAVFTGAGVSTLCGIPDFRGPQGIYARPDAHRIFDGDEFRRDPGYFYTHARDFIYTMGDRRPGVVHRVCAELERRGRCAGVITQNIDMLHRRAGSRVVIELHGSLERHFCPACGWETGYDAVAEVVKAGGLPRCGRCAGVVRPDITFFGEMLPGGALEAGLALAQRADLMLVLGSSLVVQPAAAVPVATLRAGGRVAIVNREPTPLDGAAVWRGADLAAEFAALEAWLQREDET